jgi:hypothetical protein
MKKTLCALCALCGIIAANAAWETVEVSPGGSWTVGAPCRLAAVRAASSVAAGTLTLKGVTALEVTSNVTETVTTTGVWWQRILTNSTATVTNTYAGQVVYTPPPPWQVASEGWVTNTTSREVTRAVKTGETLSLTNSLASVTCSGGLGAASPTNAWLVAGERVETSGTAKGRVWLMLEK